MFDTKDGEYIAVEKNGKKAIKSKTSTKVYIVASASSIASIILQKLQNGSLTRNRPSTSSSTTQIISRLPIQVLHTTWIRTTDPLSPTIVLVETNLCVLLVISMPLSRDEVPSR